MPSPTDAQLEALIASPREDLHIELKAWLDLADNAGRATLAKAIIALANHGGGFVLIGFDDPAGEAARPATGRPATLEVYSQDAVNGIVQAYAAPPFHCSVHHVSHPTTGDCFPIVVVPGGHKVPVQAVKGSPDQKTLINGKYYIRRQGPQSAEPSTPEEWRELVMRSVRAGRDDLLDAIRDVLAGRAPEAAPIAPDVLSDLLEWVGQGVNCWASMIPFDVYGNPELPRGTYRIAYAIGGEFQRPNLRDLLGILDRSTIDHTGWPAWWVPSGEAPPAYPLDGLLECDMGVSKGGLWTNPGTADFWRVSPEGRLLLIRGFREDDFNEPDPGTVLALTWPIRRAGEGLLHAAAMARNLKAAEARIIFTMKWSGLAGRELHDFTGRRPIRSGYVSRQNEVDLQTTVYAAAIEDGLPEIVLELLTPLYEAFNLFPLHRKMVEEELREMRRNSF